MAKRSDPTNLVGKGGGGASEIAAVSVGVYAQDNTGPGFQQAKASAAVAGAEIGTAAGANVAKKFEEEAIGSEGGSKGILGSLRGAKKTLMKGLAGVLAVPFVAAQAFNLGRSIREGIEEGFKSGSALAEDFIGKLVFGGGGEEAVNARIDSLKSKIADLAGEVGYELERYSGGTPKATKLEAEIKALDVQLEIQNSIASKLREARGIEKEREEATNRRLESEKEAALAVDESRAKDKAARELELEDQQKLIDGYNMMAGIAAEMRSEQERLNEEGAAMGSDMLASFRALTREMDARRNAARDTGLDNMASDVAQLRNLVRIGVRSRLNDPGSGEAN